MFERCQHTEMYLLHLKEKMEAEWNCPCILYL